MACQTALLTAFRYTKSMRSVLRSVCLFATLAAGVLAAWPALAQEGPLEKTPPKDITPEDIIQRFAAKEKEFKEARDLYTFRQDVKVQTVDGDTADGEYREVFDVI